MWIALTVPIREMVARLGSGSRTAPRCWYNRSARHPLFSRASDSPRTRCSFQAEKPPARRKQAAMSGAGPRHCHRSGRSRCPRSGCAGRRRAATGQAAGRHVRSWNAGGALALVSVAGEVRAGAGFAPLSLCPDMPAAGLAQSIRGARGGQARLADTCVRCAIGGRSTSTVRRWPRST